MDGVLTIAGTIYAPGEGVPADPNICTNAHISGNNLEPSGNWCYTLRLTVPFSNLAGTYIDHFRVVIPTGTKLLSIAYANEPDAARPTTGSATVAPSTTTLTSPDTIDFAFLPLLFR